MPFYKCHLPFSGTWALAAEYATVLEAATALKDAIASDLQRKSYMGLCKVLLVADSTFGPLVLRYYGLFDKVASREDLSWRLEEQDGVVHVYEGTLSGDAGSGGTHHAYAFATVEEDLDDPHTLRTAFEAEESRRKGLAAQLFQEKVDALTRAINDLWAALDTSAAKDHLAYDQIWNVVAAYDAYNSSGTAT